MFSLTDFSAYQLSSSAFSKFVHAIGTSCCGVRQCCNLVIGSLPFGLWVFMEVIN